MPIPDFQSILLPLLQFAADEREHSIHEPIDAVARVLDLSEQERNELYPSGKQRPIFADRVAWARTYLKQAGLVQDTRRAHFRITQRGLDVLADKPSRLDMRYLEQFPEYLDFKYRTRAKAGSANSEIAMQEVESKQTPKEAIELNYQRLRETLAQELLSTIKGQSPTFFERLV